MTDLQQKAPDCVCQAVRQAARHVTQFYDRFLAPAGLRTSQFSILAKLKAAPGPITINALAADMIMDRTTLGRNILPLEREGLIAIEPGKSDRRSKELQLTGAGAARLRTALKCWAEAQARFEAAYGGERTPGLIATLRGVTATDLGAADRTDR